MYIASNQKLRLLLTTLLLVAYGCGGASDKQGLSGKNKKIVLLDRQNILIYIPNSYLLELIGRQIKKSPNNIYDPAVYQFYSLDSHQGSSSTKTFKLRLLKRNSALFNKSRKKMSSVAMIAKLRTLYAEENFEDRKLVLKFLNHRFVAECEGIGRQVKIIDIPLSNMTIKLMDSAFVHQQTGNPKVVFTNKAIICHYSDNNNFIQGISAELDSKVEYQNAGCSAVYPFQFMSNFMDTVKIAYAGSTPMEKGLRIYKVKLKRLNLQQVEARFAVYHKLFPADITGRINFSSDQNKILSFPAIGYDNSINLSDKEKDFMTKRVLFVKDSIIPDLINKSLVLKFTDARIEVMLGDQKIITPVKHARISYSGESVIFRLDVI